MLTLTQEQIGTICKHAETEYPSECCGAMLGRFDNGICTVCEVLPISNQREEAAKYHRFLITSQEFLQCEKQARKQNLEVVGFYHSHPDHPAKPSQYDLEHSLPVYSYLIVSVQQGKSDKMTSWILQNDRSQFNEEEIK
ncbi:MAG: M67 family metallopeptidase [Planctomycetaceae bacterium]|jgi:proteasome lid subunit RPN8/RPN11|nr:M67 family metallopeptidase [Planctomycetaceae bacterium]